MDDPTSHGAHFFDPLAYGLVDIGCHNQLPEHYEMPAGTNVSMGVTKSEMINHHSSTDHNGFQGL